MRGERQFFGGESLDEYGKKLEKENKETEVMPWGELMTNVGEQMGKVMGSLEKEREMAADIRKMGGKVTRETADRIMNLERQKNDLLGIYEDVLEPVRKEADEAFLDRAEYVVPKPEELDALMTDPEEMEVSDDMIIEKQTSGDLASLEKSLRDVADDANEEMVDIIEKMNALKKSTEAHLRTRYEQLKGRSALIDDPATKAEMREIDAQLLPMMSKGIEVTAAGGKDAEAVKAEQLKALERRFETLRNYVVAVNDRLKDVRMNLGFARKMDEKENRKAA